MRDKLELVGSVVCFLVALMLVLSGMYAWIWSTKRVDGYYASVGERGTCAWAHWTWHADEKAFCSDDPFRVLQFIKQANAEIKGNQK